MGQFAYGADNGDVGGMFIISGAGKGISLYTNNDGFGLTGVYIAPNGYVGINLGAGDHATDPIAALEVNGNIVATNSLNPSIKLTNTTSGKSWEAFINSEVLQLTGGTTPGMIQEWYRDTGSSQVGANIFGNLFAWTLKTYQPGSTSVQGPKYKWGSVIDGSSYTFHNECIEVEINGVTKYIPLFANWE
jgi:hypothetical protein